MLLPTDLLPEKIGLVWGVPFEEPQPPTASGISRGIRWTLTNRSIDGIEYGLFLHFDELGLGCVSVISHMSRDFWEEPEKGEKEAVRAEYLSIIESLILATTQILGPPDLARAEVRKDGATSEIQEADLGAAFCGEEIYEEVYKKSPIYEKWLGGDDEPEAIWKSEEARFQIGLAKEAAEFPYEITVSVMRPES